MSKSYFLFFCFRKYIQVCVQNLSELDFRLSDSDLVDTGDSTDLQLLPLNTKSQQVTVFQNWAWTRQNTGEQGCTGWATHTCWWTWQRKPLHTENGVLVVSKQLMHLRCGNAALCRSVHVLPTLWPEWDSEGIRFSLEELNLTLALPYVQIYVTTSLFLVSCGQGMVAVPLCLSFNACPRPRRKAEVLVQACSHCLAESWLCFSCSFVTCVLDSKCWMFRRAKVLNDCLIFSFFKGFSPTNIWHYPILWTFCVRWR